MTIFETLGVLWVVFTSALSTCGLIYCAYTGITSILRQRHRGEVEEQLDIRRQAEMQFRHFSALNKRSEYDVG